MRVALAIALLAAAGLALAQVGGDAELRAVSAAAKAVEAREGALLAAREFRRTAQLMMVLPGSLRRVGRPLRLEEDFIHDFALSPDGTRVAIGSEMRNTIEVVDLRRWRSLGTIDLPGPRPAGYGGAGGLAWPRPRRPAVRSSALAVAQRTSPSPADTAEGDGEVPRASRSSAGRCGTRGWRTRPPPRGTRPGVPCG
jgi:hypothetical protein